jgi:hypothetical protein
VNVVTKRVLLVRNALLFLLLFVFCLAGITHAQQPEDNIKDANTYLDARTTSLDKYLDQSESIQQRLLKRLKRKEDKILRNLAAKDSVAYKQYILNHQLNFDSIQSLSKDTSRHLSSLGNNKVIDSLKGVQRFIQSESGKLTNSTALLGQAGIATPNNTALNSLQQKMNVQVNTDQLIQQHTADLEKIAGANNISGIQGIQKQVFYAKSKIKSYKEFADDPDKAEASALEALQGTEGFSKYLNSGNGAFGGAGGNVSAAQLQAMGYQTSASVNNNLTQKLGDNLGSVQQQMSQQVQAYSDKLNGITSKINTAKADLGEAKADINTAKATVGEAKSSVSNIDKPNFKVNPERGKPFLKRLKFNYSFQPERASIDGLRPAMLVLSATVGFKQTENLTYGIGIGSNTGLGQNWQHIAFSYEGISLRAYIDRQWKYGFSGQIGYERDFIPANRAYLNNPSDQLTTPPPSATSLQTTGNNTFNTIFGGFQQSAYIGIMKTYKINSKLNGTLLVGYNFLWQNEGGKSPWLLRFGWGSAN